jgi:hypothetical protein
MDQMMVEQNSTLNEEIDFLANKEFMNLKMFMKKKDQYEEKSSNLSSVDKDT